MLHFLKLIRWKNLLIISFTQVCTFAFLRLQPGYNYLLDFRFILLLIATFLLAASGYIINDYSDVKIDSINKPGRNIIGTYISARMALLLHITFNIAGIAIGFYLNRWLGCINIFTAWLLWRYSASYKYKLLVGNIVVAFLMGLSLLVVYIPFSKIILLQWVAFYAGFAFLTGLSREIIKDMEDMEGDMAFNCRTVPIVFGIYRSRIILTYINMVTAFLLCFIIVYFLYWHEFIFPIYLSLVVLLPLGRVILSLQKADTKKLFTILSRRMKLIMVSGTLSMGLRWLICIH